MQTKKDTIRTSILDEARKDYLAAGFDTLSMRRLATRVGISPGNVYTYFASKEDLFYTLVMEEQDRRLDTMRSYVEAGSTGMDKLRRYAIAYFDYAKDHPEDLRKSLLWFVRGGDEGTISQAVIDELSSGRTAHADWFLAIVREGVSDGTIDAGLDPIVFMKQYTMTLRLVINEVAVLDCEPYDFFTSFVDFFLRSACPRDGGASR